MQSLDVFHVSVDMRRLRLLEDCSKIAPRAESDWEDDDVAGEPDGSWPPVTAAQIAVPTLQCEMSLISKLISFPPAPLEAAFGITDGC